MFDSSINFHWDGRLCNRFKLYQWNYFLLIMFITPFISSLIRVIIALVAIAFYTLMERKFLGYFQTRKGPNKPSIIGIPQPFADAIKLFIKEQTKPTSANIIPFILAPTLRLSLAIFIWLIYPHFNPRFFIIFGILFFLSVSRISVYATFAAGWSSNSKYALLGALRGVAQTVSYEVRMSLILLASLYSVITLNFNIININIKSWIALIIIPSLILWFITNLAETNRTPFDFAEGESELVSGFNIEYGRGPFAFIFIAEYIRILAIRLFTSIIFRRTLIPLLQNFSIVVKTLLLATLFVWIRATIPRIRYDHLIFLTWKCFLPFALVFLLLILPLIII